jgi:hypothetical protein
MRGTTATSNELTGHFGSALEDTSIGDYRLVALFAEKSLEAIFGVLQHNPGESGLVMLRASYSGFDRCCRKMPGGSWLCSRGSVFRFFWLGVAA